MPSNLFLLKIFISLLADDLVTRNSATTRKSWSKDEEEELVKLFPKAFLRGAPDKHTYPNQKAVTSAMLESKCKNGPMFRKGRNVWSTVKKKVHRLAISGKYTV